MQSGNNQSSLHEFAAENDVHNLTSKILSLRMSNILDIDKRNRYGCTPLHVAALNNSARSHFEVAEILLNYGADPNARDFRDCTPVCYLIENGVNVEILRLFSRFKADFTPLRRQKFTLLKPAIENDRYSLKVIKFLVQDIGLDVNFKDENGMTPLHYAVNLNNNDSHYELLEFLLEMGADVNFKSFSGERPLHNVIRSGNSRVFDLFLKYNVDLHAFIGKKKNYILFKLIGNISDVKILDKLLNLADLGLDVNQTDQDKFTPLHLILDTDFYNLLDGIETIKCLLKNGANVNALDNYGVTPLVYALPGITTFFLKNKQKATCFADFLFEQADFSVAHERFYMDKYVGKFNLKHLAKLKFLKIPVHPTIQEVIDDRTCYKNYFDKCTKELVVMSDAKPQNSWISYFNLLIDDRRKLKNYAGSEDLIEDYKNNDWLEMFPIYGNSMKRNVYKGLRRRELFDKSSVLLSDCLPIFNPNHLIVTDILDCVLGKKYLSKFLSK